MEIQAFKQISDVTTLASNHLKALWYELNGDWDTAHRIVQKMNDANAMWIHAYLHRKEPDISNAKYWYRSAGKPYPEGMSFDAEVQVLLNAIAG